MAVKRWVCRMILDLPREERVRAGGLLGSDPVGQAGRSTEAPNPAQPSAFSLVRESQQPDLHRRLQLCHHRGARAGRAAAPPEWRPATWLPLGVTEEEAASTVLDRLEDRLRKRWDTEHQPSPARGLFIAKGS